MRIYEVGVIVRSDLNEEDLSGQLEQFDSWVSNNGGSIQKADRWGRRRLAYPINGQNDGFYVFYKAELPEEAPAELERLMRLSENYLRFMIIRDEAPQSAEAPAEQEEAANEDFEPIEEYDVPDSDEDEE